MRAGGLGRNPRRKGKLAGGQGSAIEKRRNHRSSRRLPDQRRYLGDERACNHVAYIACDLAGRADEQFDGRRSLLASLLKLYSVSADGPLSITTSDQRRRTSAEVRAKWIVLRRGLGRRRSANRSARPKGASMCSRSSGSNRTPTANVGDAKRSKASAVDESGPNASPNFALNQRCTRAWLRTSTMLPSGSSKARV